MFTMKKGNLVRIIALIVMIVMVASVALTSCGDKEAKDAAANAQTSADKAQNSANDAADKIATLNQTIAALQAALDELKEGTAANEAELRAIIDALATELAASDAALAEALAELANVIANMTPNWDAATDVVLEKLAELAEAYQAFLDDAVYYYDAEVEVAEKAYAQAQVAILRATSVDDADSVIEDYVADIAALPTVAEKLDAVLAEVEENGVEYPADGEKLDEAEDILEYGKTVAEVYADILAFGEGEEKVNLEQKYFDLRAEYNELLKEAGGRALKERMDAVIALDTTLAVKADVESIVKDFYVWATLVQAGATTDEEAKKLLETEIKDIEGFEDTIKAFEKVVDRIVVLEAAKDAADLINADIAALEKAGLEPDEATSVALKTLEKAVADWCKTYAIPSDETAEGFIQANYDLVDHAKLATLRSNFETLIKELRDSFAEFVNAVNAIGTVTPDSGDAINAAWKAYFKCAALNQIYNLDAVLGLEEGENVAHYYAKLSTANAIYVEVIKLIEKIHTSIDALAAIEDMDVLQAAINAIDADIKTLTSDEGYAQDISVLDAEKLVALEQARIIPLKKIAIAAIIAGYDRAIAALEGKGDANESYETKVIKLENSKNGQINYVNGIKYDEKFGINNDKTAVDEITRCGTASYIDAMFAAALPYVPSTVYTIEFEGADSITVGQNLYFTFPAAAEIEGKVFMGWKASATATKVYAVGASLAATAQVAEIKWIPVYSDGYVVDSFAVAKGENNSENVLDLTKIDTSKDITVKFFFQTSEGVGGGADDNGIVSLNGKRVVRVTGGGGLHIFNEADASYPGGQQWGGFPNFDPNGIFVELVINVDAQTVNAKLTGNGTHPVTGEFYWTNGERIGEIPGFTALDAEELVIKFGGANSQAIKVLNLVVTYTLAE